MANTKSCGHSRSISKQLAVKDMIQHQLEDLLILTITFQDALIVVQSNFGCVFAVILFAIMVKKISNVLIAEQVEKPSELNK